MSGTPKEVRAAEAQAIARAHRRGQEKVVTIVRLIIKDTIELKTFIDVYGAESVPQTVAKADELEALSPTKPRLIKTKSLSTLVASSPSLKRSGSVANLLAESEFF